MQLGTVVLARKLCYLKRNKTNLGLGRGGFGGTGL